MKNNTVETLIAAAVIVIAVGFYLFAYNATHDGDYGTYQVNASLSSVDGITAGADIRLHGIKVGTVTAIALNTKSYKPVATLALRNDIHFSDDSTARIASGILNGNPYLAIDPGRDGKMLAADGNWKAN